MGSSMRTGRRRTLLPEAMLVEIIARLPLRSIARFKSVCKTWKSVIESPYFRRLFLSLHRDSSSSWSLMFRVNPITEAIGFHGCETWDLPKSLASYIISFTRYLNLPDSLCYYVASSNGLIWIEIFVYRTQNMPYINKSFVGNPVLQQWVEIPPPPEPCQATGLVTRVEEDGVVSSFKVVRTCGYRDRREVNEWRVYVYSSVTGKWSFKRLVSSCLNIGASRPSMNLNGMIYVWVRDLDPSEPEVLVSHDFYGPEEDDQCRDIPLSVPVLINEHVRRCLTTSGGHVFLVQVLYQRLKLWKLMNNNNSDHGTSEVWQLSHGEINMESFGFGFDCYPMAMNPFDSDIVYLWSRLHGCLVSVNLGTKESEKCGSSEGWCVVNTRSSKKNMEDLRDTTRLIILSQFVLPRWMDQIDYPS